MTSARWPKLGGGPLTAAAGAILLLVSLFVDWFEPGVSAWNTFEVLDLVLALLGLAALASAVGPRHEYRLDHRLLPALGVVTMVVVVSQLVNHPPGASDRSLETGAWLALAGAVVMLIGGVLTRAAQAGRSPG